MERVPDDIGDSEMTAKRHRAERQIGHEAFAALVEHGDLHTGLPDLSVSSDVAQGLMRRRWSAAVEVILPKHLRETSGELLTDVVESHLAGREPFAVIEGPTLLAIFSVDDRSDSNLADVRRFALGLANLVGGGQELVVQQAIRYVDSSDYDHLAPDERWPFSV